MAPNEFRRIMFLSTYTSASVWLSRHCIFHLNPGAIRDLGESKCASTLVMCRTQSHGQPLTDQILNGTWCGRLWGGAAAIHFIIFNPIVRALIWDVGDPGKIYLLLRTVGGGEEDLNRGLPPLRNVLITELWDTLMQGSLHLFCWSSSTVDKWVIGAGGLAPGSLTTRGCLSRWTRVILTISLLSLTQWLLHCGYSKVIQQEKEHNSIVYIQSLRAQWPGHSSEM